MTLGSPARAISLAPVSRRTVASVLVAYVFVPAALGWFAYVFVSGAVHLAPQQVRLPSSSVYDPYLDDFTVFYSAGILSRQASGDDVYDVQAIHAEEARAVGYPTGGVLALPFFTPPFALGIFTLLSLLSLSMAAAVWTAAGLASAAASAAALVRARPALMPVTATVFILGTLASPPFFQTLLHGQTTFFLLVGFVLFWLGIAPGRRNDLLLTCGLTLMAHKPQLAILPAAYLLAVGAWRPVAQAAAVVGLLTLGTAALTSWQLLADHVRLLANASQWHDQNGISTWSMFGWNAFAEGLGVGRWSATALTLALDGATVAVVIAGLRRVGRQDRDRVVAVLICGALLLSPHVYQHDVLLMAIPVFLMGTAAAPARRIAWATFGAIGWVVLYFHFDLLNTTSVNFTALWLAGGLALAAFLPDQFQWPARLRPWTGARTLASGGVNP